MPYDTSQLPILSAVLGGAAPPTRDSLGSILGSSAVQAYGNLRYGLPAAVERVAGTLTPEDEKYYAAWNQQKAEQAQAMAPHGVAQVSDLPIVGSGQVGFGRFLAENLTSAVPLLGATVAGGLAGGPVGAVAATAPLFAGQNASQALSTTGGITEDQALKGLAVSVPQAGLAVLADRFLPGASKVFGSAAAGAIDRGIVGRVVQGGVEGAVSNAVAMTGQQALSRYAAGLPMTNQDAQSDLVNAFGSGVFVGGTLGGLGGILRKATAGKAPSEISNDDLGGVVDAATTPGQSPQLALPPPSMFTDAAGRSAPGAQGFADLQATPRENQAPPELDTAAGAPALGQLALPAPEPAPADAAVTPGGKVVPADPRLAQLQAVLENQPSGDLNALLERANDPNAPDVHPTLVEAVQRELASRAESSTGAAAVSTPAEGEAPKPFTFEDATQGIRLNQDIKKLQGASEEDFHAGIRKLLEDGDERKGTLDVAERLGILDDKTAAPAGPVEDVAEKDPLHSLLMDQPETARNAQVALLDKNARADLEAKVVDALGKPVPDELAAPMQDALAKFDETGAPVPSKAQDPAQSYSDRLDKLAGQLGLVDKDGLTDKGKAIALAAPVTEEDLSAATEAAAAKNPKLDTESFEAGYKGLDVPKGTELTPEQQASYEQGQAAKVPDVAPKKVTDAVADRIGKGAAETNPEMSAVVDKIEALKSPREVTTDAGTKELAPPVPDTEIAALQRMVTEGRSPEEISRAVDDVAQGGSRFAQPAESARPTHAGEVTVPTYGGESVVATRGAPRAALARAGDVREVQTKQSVRAETAQAVRDYQHNALRGEIDAAYKSEDITPRERVSLIRTLASGDHQGVIDRLPGGPLSSTKRSLIDQAADKVTQAHRDFEQKLTDAKDFHGALGVLRSQAPNAETRQVTEKIAQSIKQLERAGIKFDINVAKPGDSLPDGIDPRASGSAGYEAVGKATTMRVWLAGADMAHPGTNYETLLHEMTHAATLAASELADHDANFAKTPAGKAATELNGVLDQVRAHLQNREAAGNLTRFEQDVIARRNNALDDRDELMAWTLSNPEMQAYLKTVQATPSETLWGKVVDAVRKFFGLDPKYNNALEQVLHLSDQVMGATADQYSAVPDLHGTPKLQLRSAEPTIPETNTALKDTVSKTVEAVGKLRLGDLPGKVAKAAYGWVSDWHLAQQYGHLLPGLHDAGRVGDERSATVSKNAHVFNPQHQAFNALEKTHQNDVNWLMQLTQHGLDPAKRWEDQPNRAQLEKLPNVADMRATLVDANRIYHDGGRAAATKVYEGFKAINQSNLLRDQSVRLYNLVRGSDDLRDAVTGGFTSDPMADYRASPTTADPAGSLKFWSDRLGQQIASAKAHVEAVRGTLAGLNKRDQNVAEQHLSPVENQLKLAQAAITRNEGAPYFHLGRDGDQFVSFTLKNTKGIAAKADVLKAAKAVEAAGFDGIHIDPNATDPKVYVRLNGESQRKLFENEVLKKLNAAKLTDDEAVQKGGPRDASGVNVPGRDAWLQQAIESVKSDPAYSTEGLSDDQAKELKERQNETVRQLKAMHLESLNDNSLLKVMAQRVGRQGFNKDMVQSFARRNQIDGLSIANLSSAPAYSEAYKKMHDTVAASRELSHPLHDKTQQLFDVYNEALKRRYTNQTLERSLLADKFRAVTNFAGIGMSPAYVGLQFTQLGTMLWPELGAKHGFVNAASAIGRATGPAFKAMAEVAKAAKSQGSLATKIDAVADMEITRGALVKAGLSKAQQDLVMQMVADGTLDVSSASRAQGRVASGEGTAPTNAGQVLDRTLRWGSTMGLYGETTTRLIAALATQDLHADGKVKMALPDYTRQVLKNAMFDYSSGNMARKLGDNGFLGKSTKIVTQFMTYQVNVLEKLYRESHELFTNEHGNRAESAKFLSAHLAAMTMLAGTLGLPFASVAARAYEKLHDIFSGDDQPYDATAAWGNFLKSMFGETAGDVLRRGVPRALGFDLSSRAGEADVLPGTQWLTDRRSIKDATKEQALRALGAGPNMGINVGEGLSKIVDGNVVQGLTEMLPVAIKNPLKAYQMTEHGYTDGHGNALPITPDAADVLYQLLGFTPADKAKYQEKVTDKFERQTSLSRQSKDLSNQLVQAAISGDHDSLRDLIRSAQKFDVANPKAAVLPGIEGAIKRRVNQTAIAKATNTPLGVSPDDIAGQQLVRY